MKTFEETKLSLKTVITKQQNDLKEQEEKFLEAGNPDFDTLVTLENSMNKRIDLIGQTLKESLLKEVQSNNIQFENKFNEMMTQNRTYAESLKNIQPSAEPATIPTVVTNLRTIIEETRNEDLAEENEKKIRACNIIIHGVSESSSTENDEAKKHDVDFVTNLNEAISITTETPKNIIRLGKADQGKKRPIKVVLNSEYDKNNIMANLRKLKDQELYKRVSITDDYTIKERQMIKEKAAEAKANNDEEPPNSRYIWRIRGTPKNGLIIKKFLKQRPSVLPTANHH